MSEISSTTGLEWDTRANDGKGGWIEVPKYVVENRFRPGENEPGQPLGYTPEETPLSGPPKNI